MFERFTAEARGVVTSAQQVATTTGTARIDTRHLLVAIAETGGVGATALQSAGLAREGVAERVRIDLRSGGLDGEALASLGIDLDAVRQRADEVFGAGALERAGRSRRGHIPFTPDAKKALELALREAIRLGERHIDNRHLLLGILRADCPGLAALVEAGGDVDAVRRAAEPPGERSA